MSDQSVPLFVKVDRDKCCGYTTCSEICPEVYKLDEQGFAYVESDVVPRGLEAQAREGAESCPARAITLSATRLD
jgi:ferredoxin